MNAAGPSFPNLSRKDLFLLGTILYLPSRGGFHTHFLAPFINSCPLPMEWYGCYGMAWRGFRFKSFFVRSILLALIISSALPFLDQTTSCQTSILVPNLFAALGYMPILARPSRFIRNDQFLWRHLPSTHLRIEGGRATCQSRIGFIAKPSWTHLALVFTLTLSCFRRYYRFLLEASDGRHRKR